MLAGLNKQQKEAVLQEGNVLLTACPGSGKTRVLTHKIAHELQFVEETKNVIVALTFTNRAADEIKRRLIKMDIDPAQVWAGTIHSFSLEWILRPYSSELDELKKGFSIADEIKSDEILKGLKANYGYGFFDEINTRLNKDGTINEIDRKKIKLIQEYHEILKNEKLIDFDQILFFAYQLLEKYPIISKTLNNLFHLICVDEYQDTQDLQYAIIASIFKVEGCKAKLFIVGDRDQAIYGSLGGVAKNADEIIEEFGNIELTQLELSGNYRSTQRIIDYYRNFQVEAIEIESQCEYANERGTLSLDATTRKDDLVEVIAAIIENNIANGIPEHEICVLAPQWWLVIPMGRKLKNKLPHINFDAIGLSPLIKANENIWVKASKLFLTEPSPRMYFLRNRWANELANEFEALGVSILESFERKSKRLLKIINTTTSDSENGLDYLQERFQQMLEIMGISLESNEHLQTQWNNFFDGSKAKMENADFDYAKDTKSFKRLFNHNSGVVVNTCHGIKGEEFHTVIAFGMLTNYIPHWKEEDLIASGKKLLYVICSRAKNNLHLIAEKGRTTRRGAPLGTTSLLANVRYPYDI
jgi:DNA helicase II / ATP-dependent DNA helicase PcrA